MLSRSVIATSLISSLEFPFIFRITRSRALSRRHVRHKGKAFSPRLAAKVDKRFDSHLARLKRKGRRSYEECEPENENIGSARRKKVDARAAGLIAEEMTLRNSGRLVNSRPQTVIDLSKFRIHASFLKGNIFDGAYEDAFRDIPFQSSTHPTWYPTW